MVVLVQEDGAASGGDVPDLRDREPDDSPSTVQAAFLPRNIQSMLFV